jgi:hypothetical protein
MIRNSTIEESKALLEESMKLQTAAEIERFVRGYMSKRFPDDFYSEK